MTAEPTLPRWAVLNPRCERCLCLLATNGTCPLGPHDEEAGE